MFLLQKRKIQWSTLIYLVFFCQLHVFVTEKKDTMDGHFSKLLNSLIEICVVVGMDQDTGLVPASSPAVCVCIILFFCNFTRGY